MLWGIHIGQTYTKNNRELHKNILRNDISNSFGIESIDFGLPDKIEEN